MEKFVFGTGKPRECWPNGKRMNGFASPPFGIHTRHPKWPQRDGMASLNSGTRKIKDLFYHLYPLLEHNYLKNKSIHQCSGLL